MKRFMLFFFERILFGSLAALVPAKKGLMLFGSGFNKFSDNPKFLFLYFQNKNEYSPIWISPSRSEVKDLRDKGYNCYYRWSFDAIWAVVRAPIFFVSHNVTDVFPVIPQRGIVINLWHGTPIKKIGFDSLKEREWIDDFQNSGRTLPYQRWNYFVAASPQTSFIFESAMHLPTSKIKPLGQPRTNPIFDSTNDKEIKAKIEAKLQFVKETGDRRKILYTPTFRNNELSTSKIKESLMEVDKALDKKQNQVILFKPHPLDKSIFDDQFFESLENVFNVSNEDTQDLLCVADILITDYSSIMFDFMITGKPIISYIFDFDDYVAENGGLYFSFEEIGTTVAKNSLEFVSFILDPDTISRGYDKLKFNTTDSCKEINKFLNSL